MSVSFSSALTRLAWHEIRDTGVARHRVGSSEGAARPQVYPYPDEVGVGTELGSRVPSAAIAERLWDVLSEGHARMHYARSTDPR